MLLVQQGAILGKVIGRKIAQALQVPVRAAPSLVAATELLRNGGDFQAAVVDLELPDDDPDQIIDAIVAFDIPTLALTERCDPVRRERILEKAIVDYFLSDEQGIKGVIRILRRLHRNPSTRVLVVDDSRTFRLMARRLLAVHRFDVIEATDGEDGLQRVMEDPTVRLVLADYEMPRMNGLEMVQQLRALRGRDELAIIGLSAVGSGELSALFLKHGADDFLNKPFAKEEFYCRVYHSVETVERMQAIQRAAFTDQLTGLSNRLHFFQVAPPLYDEAVAADETVTAAMIDIDHFKAINDTFGHAGGDMALRQLGAVLRQELQQLDIVARFGGEEFCVLTRGLDAERAPAVFEELRQRIEAASIDFEGRRIHFTLSIGVAQHVDASLDAMINRADRLLYDAKIGGRNRVVCETKHAGARHCG